MQKRIALTALVFFLSARAAPQAQQGATLTALDFYQIHELNARYNHGLDRGDGNLFASLFSPDGVLVDENGTTTTGRSQLAALAAATPEKGPTNVSHFYVNLVVDPAPGGAIVKSYAMIGTAGRGGQPGKMTIGGQYWDNLVKTADGWQIKKRIFLKQGTPRPDTDPLATTMPNFAPTPARQKANGLTLADYAEIYQIYARSAIAYDKALENGRMWANLFTTDGTYVDGLGANPLPKPGATTTGRDKLMEYVAQRGPLHVTTLITNVMLERTVAGVNARAYVMQLEIPRLPATAYEEPAGMLFDQLVKTAEGWRIKIRHSVPANASVPDAVAAVFKTR